MSALALLAAVAFPMLAAAPPSATAVPAAKIKHVVIIVQENRSFDNVFHGFPGADTVDAGKGHDGRTIRLREVGFLYPHDLNHRHDDFLQQYDHGKMDGFDLEHPDADLGAPQPVSDLAYSYLPRREVQPYFDMASQYVVADRMFQTNSGPSFTAHQYLIAGQSGGAIDNPDKLRTEDYAWGCDSPPESRVDTIWDYGEGHGVFPCFDYRTLGDELDDAGLGWRYYAPSFGHVGAIWSAYDAIRHIRYGPDWKEDIVTPETRVLQDIAGGRLPPLSWIVPATENSDHAFPVLARFKGAKLNGTTGPSWVTAIVNSIGQSSYWNDTAIFVLWDDWGGWYDHVPPPQRDRMGFGPRVPLIIISPYAKRGYVSHVQHDFGSLLKFSEEVYGLPSLGGADAHADDLEDCFDFSQPPRAFVPITAPEPAAFFLQTKQTAELPPDND
jgi:phospholipase C